MPKNKLVSKYAKYRIPKKFLIKENKEMSLSTRMAEKKNQETVREAVRTKLYKSERTYRADKLVEAWSRIPEVNL